MLRVFHEYKVALFRGLDASDPCNLDSRVAEQGSTKEFREILEPFHGSCIAVAGPRRKVSPCPIRRYNRTMQRKAFWLVVIGLEICTYWLPFWLEVISIVPIAFIAWWVAYRSDWF
jgi:hypothetical protein